MEEEIRGAKALYGIVSALQESELFTFINVIELIDEEAVKLIKVKAKVLNGTFLYITELSTPEYQKYSYHWQEASGDLIVRWDNKRHWKHLSTFPHHRHEKGRVFSSGRVNVDDVIDKIRQHLDFSGFGV